MKSRRVLLVISFSLALATLLACAQSVTPTKAPPTATQAPTTTTPSPKASPTQSASPAAKPTAADSSVSFAGKTITLIVTVSAGGATDVMARFYSLHLGKFLPGQPKIIVRNMVGGESAIGANYAYKSRPDGLTLLTSTGSVFNGDMLKKPAVEYSLTKMTTIIASPTSSLYFIKPGIIGKPEDVMNARGIIFGHSAGNTGNVFILAKETLGFPIDKVTLAYGGDSDAFRAFLGGEITATGAGSAVYESLAAPAFTKGEAIPLFQVGQMDASGAWVGFLMYPRDMPTIQALYEKIHGKAPAGLTYEGMVGIALARAMDKGLLLPPGTPDAIVKAYWNAAERMTKDPEFLKQGEVFAGKGTPWLVGEPVDKTFKAKFGLKPEVLTFIRDLLEKKYGFVLS